MRNRIYFIYCLLTTVPILASAQNSSGLILTEQGIEEIRVGLGKAPLFNNTLESIRQEVDQEIIRGIDVPVPKDLAGGYTHERHKLNFFFLHKAGLLYQITGKEKYAEYVKQMLLEYLELYPTLDRHPEKRSYAPGKIFWQSLNDANWLVYASQAYDNIYHWLDKKTRNDLNAKLFRPMADFLSVENPRFFDRIHNHSTWGNAAVGMIGLVMNDEELVQRALFGTNNDLSASKEEDNDGGLIFMESQKEKGFLAQIDHAFSPDGYYTEGPYYQRYAMYPFLIFAQALANNKPELDIFSYRDSVLLKGVVALLNQTTSDGEFFPVNDAQKGMSYRSRELTTAVNIAYYYGDQNPALLSIAQEQERVSLDQTGMAVALAIASGKAEAFVKKSIQLRDGAKGDEGAIGILRSKSTDGSSISLLMKYSKHGMGHGHFDKLSYTLYQDGDEVVQDYGAARWVNIEQKDGGGYLKENTTWAKQTIAHNTVVVDSKSQFNGNVKEADKHHPEPYLFACTNEHLQVVSAIDENSYSGLSMHRTMVMINEQDHYPIILDLYKIDAEGTHTYDLPVYYKGELLETNFEIKDHKTLEPLGDSNGYQHLWKEAEKSSSTGVARLNWLENKRFYTLTTAVKENDELIFGRIGANDPKFNLRRDPVFIIRKKEAGDEVFATVLEMHGSYSPVTERPENSRGMVDGIEVVQNNDEYLIVKIIFKDQREKVFAMALREPSDKAKHQVEMKGDWLIWEGPFKLF